MPQFNEEKSREFFDLEKIQDYLKIIEQNLQPLQENKDWQQAKELLRLAKEKIVLSAQTPIKEPNLETGLNDKKSFKI